MIFTTFWFVVFASVFFPLYWLIRVPQWRFGAVLVACFIFHAHFAGPAGVLPIVVLGAAAYFAGLCRRRWVLAGAMALSIIALVGYKYTEFLSRQIVGLFSQAWAEQVDQFRLEILPGAPPLAISFFTFEFVHYLYDVYKGGKSIRSPFDFLAFVFFFPPLVAGPIKRYEQFIPAFHQGLRTTTLDDVKIGMLRVAWGYFKKVVLADNLTFFINYCEPRYEDLPIEIRWQVFLAIAFRILWDFSGYSDIAIGFARMMGVRLPENFNWPYLAGSIQDFWRRWHISLSTWIRDYVYIPLGGSRHGPWRRVLNGLIAFGLCGLWHGADWHFMFWGIYHGIGLAICANYRTVLGPSGEALGEFFAKNYFLSALLTFAFVSVGWLYFFYDATRATKMLLLLFVPTLDL
jgi:alginate O-acetyltransferase complex protein AlgI